MKLPKLLLLLSLTAGASLLARAEVEIYQDYEPSEMVMEVTTVKVDPNMLDVYLDGLSKTWMAGNRLAKEMGYIKDYKVFASELPQSGSFNLALVTYYAKGADLEPNKAKHMAFMEKWGKEREKMSLEIAKSYPEVRTITGQYRMRELTFK
ncbi:hypothetical protein [Gallaecimonas xiamenensis]|uniref:Uncharacterized protein n=1 Tax=Gallaecimonas xiamenensis 3-C-1 TaxID=745411 RepID=K2JEL6_9GAMM|nr:hypothetical protein [Gallaecimonas xiamenensis]EKE73092.1 hypothetical protein B3C1_10762 [Gallaecimonas xiamenensis 3-C-1]